MSGKTVPVAFNSAEASICPAVTRGNLDTSFLSMVIRFISDTSTTLAGGGALSPSSFPWHPESTTAKQAPAASAAEADRQKRNRSKGNCLIIESPRAQQPD